MLSMRIRVCSAARADARFTLIRTEPSTRIGDRNQRRRTVQRSAETRTIPLSRYPDTYNKQPICYVALSSQKNYCSLYLMGAFWSASQLKRLKAAGKKLDMGKCCVHFRIAGRFAARTDWQADLGDFEREVDRDVRTIALADQGGAGAESEARRRIGGQAGSQARRRKA